ncbi:shikimate kinase [Capnocytophaga felis]|uniref:Shikimate kinase n=1 Tax=Capnocytophaga felis TaxID=2267611 RepID=A0A5M4B6E2_9FLAO|nr:shikimate kinase [Capnocytophaga felis]GET44900.1 shikimate kinase [Capnocytophaga felis]GET49352.1 shikimate kinase [Capnocytophaga felis]
MKIILLGYMGSGKTTLGKALAKKKNFPFIDLDNYIEEKEDASVKEIFATKGEIYFRKKETFYLNELLLSEKDFVLALGGGTPCFGNNMDLISKTTKNTFYLKYNPKSLTERLSVEKNARPLISHLKNEDLEEFIQKHLFERNPYYLRANHTISMDNLSVEESLKKIDNLLNSDE